MLTTASKTYPACSSMTTGSTTRVVRFRTASYGRGKRSSEWLVGQSRVQLRNVCHAFSHGKFLCPVPLTSPCSSPTMEHALTYDYSSNKFEGAVLITESFSKRNMTFASTQQESQAWLPCSPANRMCFQILFDMFGEVLR